MDSKEMLHAEQQDLLEDLVRLVSRQTRLLEEIRDLLAARRTPRHRAPAARPGYGAEYD